jgi:hypothetical protein
VWFKQSSHRGFKGYGTKAEFQQPVAADASAGTQTICCRLAQDSRSVSTLASGSSSGYGRFTMSAVDTGPIRASGMLLEWFDLVGPETVGPPIVTEIERDRPVYAAQPGFIRKLLPIVFERDGGAAEAGGSYLFDSLANLRAHLQWTQTEHRIDGLLFHEQPFVANFRGFAGEVVGAQDFAPLASKQAANRIQVWRTKGQSALPLARKAWPILLARARDVGLSAVWLGADSETQTIGLLSVAPRLSARSELDYAALDRLRGPMSIADGLKDFADLERVVDKCMWVFTIWLPPVNGRPTQGLWPSSPPLPAPAYHEFTRENWTDSGALQ